MTTLLFSHPAALEHDMGPGHPERPDRYRAIARAMAQARFAALQHREAPVADRAPILRVHPEAYLDKLAGASPSEGLIRLDADTAMSPGTWEAALRATGGAVAAVDAVMAGEAHNAFVAMRPPGHHAERTVAMGFCFLNSAAIAARHAQAAHGAERVAVVDFDVHHGNGTQHIFWDDASVMYASTHEMPLYPGTGARGERGTHGTIVNAPLSAGNDGAVFREAMETAILPRLRNFAPDLIIISAGFDAHRLDPLGHLKLVGADYGWVTGALMEIADRSAKGRVVSVLEGGYSLEGLGESASAHMAALMGVG